MEASYVYYFKAVYTYVVYFRKTNKPNSWYDIIKLLNVVQK
jgi:hypothetical protein